MDKNNKKIEEVISVIYRTGHDQGMHETDVDKSYESEMKNHVKWGGMCNQCYLGETEFKNEGMVF